MSALASCPRDENGQPVPPPMTIVRKGWFTHRTLDYSEAEAHCLREAARMAGSPRFADRCRQEMHLIEAERNRIWHWWNIGGPPRSRPKE